MIHCQVQVLKANRGTFRGFDGLLHRETEYCSNPPEYECDSGFKFCAMHKVSHGTKGKKGHIHTFKKLKVNSRKRQS